LKPSGRFASHCEAYPIHSHAVAHVQILQSLIGFYLKQSGRPASGERVHLANFFNNAREHDLTIKNLLPSSTEEEKAGSQAQLGGGCGCHLLRFSNPTRLRTTPAAGGWLLPAPPRA